jgi:hypothetical protein
VYTETDRGDDDSSVDSNQVVDWILKLNTMGHKGSSSKSIYSGLWEAQWDHCDQSL